MKNALLIFLLLFLLPSGVLAQTEEAQKIDEFGFIYCDELMSRLDNLFSQVFKEKNYKGFIMIYEGKLEMPIHNRKNKVVNPQRGEAKARIRTIQKYMAFRNIDSEKIEFVESGLRNNFTIELWLLPNGTLPPQPTLTVNKIKYRKGKATDICENF